MKEYSVEAFILSMVDDPTTEVEIFAPLSRLVRPSRQIWLMYCFNQMLDEMVLDGRLIAVYYGPGYPQRNRSLYFPGKWSVSMSESVG